MTFTDALHQLFTTNARIRRRLWSTRVFVGVENDTLCIKGFSSRGPDDGKWHPWVITSEDYFASDWEVME